MEQSINEQLHKNPLYKDKKCFKCNRGYPDTILNIEGVIHHNLRYFECIDKKSCKKYKKKLKCLN